MVDIKQDLGIQPKEVDPTERAGVMGTAIYGGYIANIEKNRNLNGENRYKTYSENLTNTSIVAAGVRYFLNVITKSSWKVEPADKSDEAKRIAEFIEEMMYDMETPWFRVIRKAALYKFYGFSVQEWTAKKRDDGLIGMLDVEARPQRTIVQWDVESSGTVNGVVQQSPQTFERIYLPRKKLVYLVDDALTDSPEGLGLFRHLVEACDRLRRYEQLEGFGFETDLRGIPVGRAPFAALDELVRENVITEAQKNQILLPMKTFIENHIRGPKLGMLLDSSTYTSTNDATTPSIVRQWDVELLKGAGGDSLTNVFSAIQRVNGEIARVLGVEGLLLGAGQRGSQALSRDKSDNFYLVVDSALREITESYTKEVITPIMDLNGWDKKLSPWFKTDSIQLRDVETITNALRDMAQSGAVMQPDDPAILEVRDLLGLSRPVTIPDAEEDASLLDNKDDKTKTGDEP